jgi:hypothetical protein
MRVGDTPKISKAERRIKKISLIIKTLIILNNKSPELAKASAPLFKVSVLTIE